MVARIPRPKVPRITPLPSRPREVDFPTFEALDKIESGVDEFGLSTKLYGDFPREQRRLIAKMIRFFGAPKNARPPAAASVAEAIFFGLLLDHDFQYREGVTSGSRNFIFQSYELGGRQPGGSVVDFLVYYNHVAIAVRVQSVFHDARDPFGGGGQVQVVEQRLKDQLKSSFFIHEVVDVNQPPARVLETAEDPAVVHREIERVMGEAA